MKALLLLAAVTLAGCALVPMAEVPRDLLADTLHADSPRPAVDADIFALSDDMRRFAAGYVAWDDSKHKPLYGFAAYLQRELGLDYDAASTRPAPETFAARSGNCLSLVILSAAFAKHLGIPITYQRVYRHDVWSRSGEIAFLSAHVNLRLGVAGAAGPVIDFLGVEPEARFHARMITETVVRAMYFNNRAAEALVAGQPGPAYWWARAAIEAAPQYLAAFNTLGLIYLHEGHLREAERTLRYVLVREPESIAAMGNLARVLTRGGRPGEAAELRARMAAIEPYPPFYFLDLGLAALARGAYDEALGLLSRELRRIPYNDEVHFGLALVHLRQGDFGRARSRMTLAMQYSTARDRREFYKGQLASLEPPARP